MKKLMALIGMIVLVSVAASAQYKSEARSRDNNYEPLTTRSSRSAEMSVNVVQRQAREKIAAGIVNGSITSREARALLEMAERIETKENRFMRNGRLSSSEKRELEADLQSLEKAIWKSRRDRDNRYGQGNGRRF